jgi:hypothetical protein
VKPGSVRESGSRKARSRVGDEAIAQQTGRGELRPLLHQRTETSQSGSGDRSPSGIVEVLLVGVDNHVASFVRSGSNQRLCDGERGTPVGKPDLDHRARILSQEKVTQDVAISDGQ